MKQENRHAGSRSGSVILPHRLVHEGDQTPLRLTTIAQQAAMEPEAHEVDLALYAGQRISVECQAVSGEWVYGAGEISVLDLERDDGKPTAGQLEREAKKGVSFRLRASDYRWTEFERIAKGTREGGGRLIIFEAGSLSAHHRQAISDAAPGQVFFEF